MLKGLLRCKALRPLHLQQMPLASPIGWQQAKAATAVASCSVPRSLDIHAPIFVPRLRPTALSASSCFVSNRGTETHCGHAAEPQHYRPALPPLASPCSTSGREALTVHNPSSFRGSAVFNPRYTACYKWHVASMLLQRYHTVLCLQCKGRTSICCSCHSCRAHVASRVYCGVQN